MWPVFSELCLYKRGATMFYLRLWGCLSVQFQMIAANPRVLFEEGRVGLGLCDCSQNFLMTHTAAILRRTVSSFQHKWLTIIISQIFSSSCAISTVQLCCGHLGPRFGLKLTCLLLYTPYGR